MNNPELKALLRKALIGFRVGEIISETAYLEKHYSKNEINLLLEADCLEIYSKSPKKYLFTQCAMDILNLNE